MPLDGSGGLIGTEHCVARTYLCHRIATDLIIPSYDHGPIHTVAWPRTEADGRDESHGREVREALAVEQLRCTDTLVVVRTYHTIFAAAAAAQRFVNKLLSPSLDIPFPRAWIYYLYDALFIGYTISRIKRARRRVNDKSCVPTWKSARRQSRAPMCNGAQPTKSLSDKTFSCPLAAIETAFRSRPRGSASQKKTRGSAL